MTGTGPPTSAPVRSRAVDAVRGLVIVVMALDHVRDFLGNAHFDATDLAQTTAPLFVTRWITHVCAPTFFLETFGRVPLFFYLIHIPLIHLVAVVYSLAAFGAATWLISGPVIFWDTALPGSPPSYGLGLPGVYAVWIAVVIALYPACRWYAARAVRR
jgi:uncharacterized membrane protein